MSHYHRQQQLNRQHDVDTGEQEQHLYEERDNNAERLLVPQQRHLDIDNNCVCFLRNSHPKFEATRPWPVVTCK